MQSFQRRSAVVIAVLLVVAGLFLLKRNQALRGGGTEESGVVTVVSVLGGHRGKYDGSFPHRVRFESGTEATMTFKELFSPGDQIWVSYRRFPDNRFDVQVYVRRDASR